MDKKRKKNIQRILKEYRVRTEGDVSSILMQESFIYLLDCIKDIHNDEVLLDTLIHEISRVNNNFKEN